MRWTNIYHLMLFSVLVVVSSCTTKPVTPDDMTLCVDPRPEICTMEYAPVCGYTDSGQKTYASGCTACSDKTVIGYIQGECESDKSS